MNIVDLPAVCTLKGNGITLTFKDVWNVLELLQETKHQNTLHYSTSLVPRPRPAFRRFQYARGEPGNEATIAHVLNILQ